MDSNILKKLKELGKMPNEDLYNDTQEIINLARKYEALLESIEVREKKFSIEEYKSLVNSCTNPYVKDFLDYGVEWLEEHIS